MRKLIVLIVSVILSAVILTACSQPPVQPQDIYKSKISDLTTDVLEGKSDNFKVYIYVGEHEKFQKLDGVCGEKQSFFTVRVIPTKISSAASIEYKMTSGEKTYNGVLPKALSSRGYMQDLQKVIAYDKKVDMEITYGDLKETVSVQSVIGEGMLTYEQALNKLPEKFGEKMNALTDKNEFKGEIILRLIGDKNNPATEYFWYAAIVDTDKTMLSTLINCKSGQFAA